MTTFFLGFAFVLLDFTTPQVVEEFHHLNSKEAEARFIAKYEKNANPSVLAYVVSLEMKQAEYSYNPYKKLKIFHESRKKLDRLVSQNSSNVHLRYVRLVAQENAPDFLGYHYFLEADAAFLTAKLKVEDESDYLDIYIKANTSL